jgi:hypothetical protein
VRQRRRLRPWTVLALAAIACANPLPPETGSTNLLLVSFSGSSSQTGSATDRLPLSFTTTQTFTIDITAQKADGTTDATFNGYVRLSIVPGTVVSVSSPAGGPTTEGRNVQLQQGVASNVQVTVVSAFGDARIWVEDLGYEPADPLGNPPPECANGIDDNHNGLIDYPADPGCYFADDNTEDGGTFATGVSETIYFIYPRIADVRGVSQGGGATSFPNQQVQMDTQWTLPLPQPLPRSPPQPTKSTTPIDPTAWTTFVNDLTSVYNVNQCQNPKPGSLPAAPAGCSMSESAVQQFCQCQGLDRTPRGDVVTGLSSSGFYVSDVADPRGFSGVFAYNYTSPPNVYICDRLIAFGGTSSDFYGWTEINYPAWELEEWDPTTRTCFVPDPHVYSLADLASTSARLNTESALARVMQNPPQTDPNCYGPGAMCTASYPISDEVCVNPCGAPLPSPLGDTGYSIHIGALMGPNHPPQTGTNAYAPSANATNCDYNGDGKIDFTTGNPEDLCSVACSATPECSEYSAYLSEQQFNIVVVAEGQAPVAVVANGSTSQSFDPVASRGQQIGAFTGDVTYFSGGTVFTIVARCADDIVMDPTEPPLPSDKACVSARTIADVPAL